MVYIPWVCNGSEICKKWAMHAILDDQWATSNKLLTQFEHHVWKLTRTHGHFCGVPVILPMFSQRTDHPQKGLHTFS